MALGLERQAGPRLEKVGQGPDPVLLGLESRAAAASQVLEPQLDAVSDRLSAEAAGQSHYSQYVFSSPPLAASTRGWAGVSGRGVR